MANKKQIDEFHQILLQRQEALIAMINDSRSSIDSLKNQEVKDDYDYAEIVSDSFTEGVLANQQMTELKEIESALSRIKVGTYGICEMCDEPIAVPRLKAKPFARFCTSCRAIYEAEQENKK